MKIDTRRPDAVEISALSFETVSKSFLSGTVKVPALQSVSFSLRQGGITALVGPDGAGKTSLLRLAAGLILPDSGQIECFGTNIRDSAGGRLKNLIGYMPQRFGLYEDLTVLENFNLYADLYGLSTETRSNRFNDLMHMAGLAGFRHRLAGRLSGGMKQKLGLTCTLVNKPKLLLLDEPSVGVDPLSRRELWQIITGLVQESGTTVLLSTAYMDEAERCGDVILLDKGIVLRNGSPAAFYKLAEGYAFVLSSTMLAKRQLRMRLAGHPDVLDASVQGDSVRTLLRPGALPVWRQVFGESEMPDAKSAVPTLEDAFILLLRQHEANNMKGKAAFLPVGSTVPEHTGNAVIDVINVDRWFGNFQAVKQLSFRVVQGEIFGLLGANGAGKTTTFRMLCGLLPSSHGTLKVAGVDLRKAAPRARARIGYMSQKFSLYGHLSVRQNLDFFSHAYGLRGQLRRERINWAIQQFNLEDFADSTSADLPLGYKQRLALACALMHAPEILFLDEPTSGIDPLARREFWAHIDQLAEQGVTILVTTHFMEEAEYCDRLLIMREGEILATGSPREIRHSACHPGQLPAGNMEEAFIRLVETGGDQA